MLHKTKRTSRFKHSATAITCCINAQMFSCLAFFLPATLIHGEVIKLQLVSVLKLEPKPRKPGCVGVPRPQYQNDSDIDWWSERLYLLEQPRMLTTI